MLIIDLILKERIKESTYTMNKEQLIALATKRYHEQLQREYHYRQAIRDGSIQPFDAKTIEYWDIADKD